MAAVSGSAWMNGCSAAGNRLAEKNTPEKTHMGIMMKFISPETASMVRARLATSSPSALKASAVATHTSASCHSGPRSGTPKTSAPKPSSAPTSAISSTSRANKNDSRYSALDIGEATSRFSSFCLRAYTMANPRLHMPLPIMFMPSNPGSRKSM